MFERDPATATIGKEILPFEMSQLPEFFQKKAEVELYETPERRDQGLKHIRELARNEKCMQGLEFCDDLLIKYLRAKKYNVSKAFTQLKGYINIRRKNPQMFTNFRFEKSIKSFTDGFYTLLPYRCQDGCAVFLVAIDKWNLNVFPIDEMERTSVLLLLQSLRYQMTQVNGFKLIYDVKTASLRHLRYATPRNLYLIFHCMQDCVPARYKGIHVVNSSLISRTVWMILKPLLSDKIKNRFIFHSSNETLLNYFPKQVLPVQYGGTLENYDMSDWLRKVMQPEQMEAMFGVKYSDDTRWT